MVDRQVVPAVARQALPAAGPPVVRLTGSVEVRRVVTVGVLPGQVVLRAGRVVVPRADPGARPTLRPVVRRPVVVRCVVGRVVLVEMQRVVDAGRMRPGWRALEPAAQARAVQAARARLVGESVGRMRTDLTQVVRDGRWPSQLVQVQLVRGQVCRPIA